jgi:glycosyltransferase involved in cell wall biosynthesis
MVSGGYDLFINHTFKSVAPNLARRGIYFVMFPHQIALPSMLERGVGAALGRWRAPARITTGVTLNGRDVLLVDVAMLRCEPSVTAVSVDLECPRPVDVEVLQRDGSIAVERIEGRHTLEVPTRNGLGLFAVAERAERPDVAAAPRVRSLTANGQQIPANPRSMAQRLHQDHRRSFLATYDAISANSAYTAEWVRQWWGLSSEVITPPVRLRSPSAKQQLILSVGRFFGEQSGHSKRQLEMVEAFRRLCERGTKDWRLVLIGGGSSADRDYAMSVRRAAAGLPVELRFSAPGEVLDDHFAQASIYWHAAGLGADLQRHPDRAEHFGIAPVEAMSAGAVPVVFDAAGPGAVVRHEVDGLKYRTIDELVVSTERLIADEALRARLSANARERSQEFDQLHFEDHVRALVSSVLAGPDRHY